MAHLTELQRANVDFHRKDEKERLKNFQEVRFFLNANLKVQDQRFAQQKEEREKIVGQLDVLNKAQTQLIQLAEARGIYLISRNLTPAPTHLQV